MICVFTSPTKGIARSMTFEEQCLLFNETTQLLESLENLYSILRNQYLRKDVTLHDVLHYHSVDFLNTCNLYSLELFVHGIYYSDYLVGDHAATCLQQAKNIQRELKSIASNEIILSKQLQDVLLCQIRSAITHLLLFGLEQFGIKRALLERAKGLFVESDVVFYSHHRNSKFTQPFYKQWMERINIYVVQNAELISSP